MSLVYYLRVLRKRWVTVTLVAVLGSAAAVGITLLTTPSYAATAKSFVSIAGTGASAEGTPDSLYQDSQFALNRVESYPEIVSSPNVLGPVIEELQLNMSIRELSEEVSAINPIDTVLLNIRATNESAELSAEIANAVAEQLAIEIQALESTPSEETSENVSPVKVTTAVPAEIPVAPVAPKPALNLMLGLLLGLGLGAILAIVRERFDTTVKSSDDLDALTHASPLGSVREDEAFRNGPPVTLKADGPTVEQFRSIRTSLRFVDVDHPAHQIVVSSAVPDEGKSTISCNLAIILAQAKHSVCLVEADLRRPRVSDYLGIDASVGLSNVVAGEYELNDALVPWGRDLMTVLPAGTAPPDPSLLLGSHSMLELLAELRGRFDMVILDAPPLLAVSDAAVLGAVSDGVLLIARHGHVKKDQVEEALSTLSSVNARVLGTVLNRVPTKGRHAEYGRDYSYADRGVDQLQPSPHEPRPTASSTVS